MGEVGACVKHLLQTGNARADSLLPAQRRTFQVEIVEDIPTLLSKVDAVLLESVDGRPHWEQVEPVLRAKKPVFIDKRGRPLRCAGARRSPHHR